jgi:hypothetical protein
MTDAQTIAEAASQPGSFNIVERLLGRGMPTEDVTIYLDEKLAWDLLRLEAKHNSARKDKEAVEIEKKIERVKKELAKSAYVFTITGITNEAYDALVDQVLEQHPYEYEESINPLTGEKVRTIVQNDERDKLFNTVFMAASIDKITDPDGNVDDQVTPATAAQIKNLAPLDGIRRITEMMTEMRMAVKWMDEIENEDFSPRP